MPRYRTRSWRAFDPAASAAVATGGTAAVRPFPVLPHATASHVRILGIDPGSQRTGYGVIDCELSASKPVAHGCITAQTGSKVSTLSVRLRYIFEGVKALIEQYQPDEVAIERVFVNRNVDSALKLGHARGAALCAVPSVTPVFEYTPRAVKLAVVGFGGAEKAQVAHMVRTLLTVDGRLSADASDALAVAMCHAHSRRIHLLTASDGAALAGRPAATGRAR